MIWGKKKKEKKGNNKKMYIYIKGNPLLKVFNRLICRNEKKERKYQRESVYIKKKEGKGKKRKE